MTLNRGFEGGPGGARTHDPRIKSPMLYQLSYGPVNPSVAGCELPT
jgi:hypothetical protein